ncbi:MAG: hypothetical protein QOH93_3445 [Chloroflexia bacterium]|jgi:hypothetical protein|nr:hypothetical protein [Chloroflexia bacterium]
MVSMLAFGTVERTDTLSRGLVVSLSSELASIQGPDGRLVAADSLGYGVVQQSTSEGYALVRWTDAGFDSWIEQADLHSLGSEARLLTVEKYDNKGVCKQVRHKVSQDVGLRFNWTVELRQPNVVRVLRTDGLKWTFNHNKMFRSINVWWPQPPDDEDAEALTVAELAIRV